jgi:hypothetical protein
MKQSEKRTGIDVDQDLVSVSSVTVWYRGGHFANNEMALGAFELAYQQGMDGMGKSPAHWMGLTSEEFDAWMRNNSLPQKQQ